MEDFYWRAGQFISVRFLAKGFWLQSHPFSFSVAPNGKMIRITIKQLGDFTNKIAKIPTGTKVFIEGPFGVFTADPDKNKKYLFIAGGIGITPIRAILEELPHATKKILLYGNRTERDLVFKKELAELSFARNISVYPVISDDKNFSGEKGIITASLVKKLVPNFKEFVVYICGPKPMMDGIYGELRSFGVKKNNIHLERFSI